MRSHLPVLLTTHAIALGIGYYVAPKDQLDEEIERTGFFQTDTNKVLAATVESLRDENKMLVFAYKGTARVKAERTKWLVLGGSQELIVPAVVNYYVDLSRLSLADVTFDERAKLVRVKVPPVVMGDIAFQPEQATTINGGLLTFSQGQVDELLKRNYSSARRAVTVRGGKDGWFTLKDLKVTQADITASVAVNPLNNPKMRIDRYTGIINLSGKAGDFVGKCQAYDPNKAERQF